MGMAIEAYGFGYIRIGGKVLHRDVILLPDGEIVHPWWRREGHRLRLTDLEAVLRARPEMLVIGQGYYGRMHVPNAVVQALKAAGITAVIQPTTEAWHTYNAYRERHRTAAALHLTC